MDVTSVSQALREALGRPLTSPGSEVFAQRVMARFPGTDLMLAFADKALETLADGESHNRMAVSAGEPRLAVLFVAWSGTHREVQPERFGRYLGPLRDAGHSLVQKGVMLAGVLEIDAYLRMNDGKLAVDVEYSYLPGLLLGSPPDTAPDWPRMMMVNPSLCTAEERRVLDRLQARPAPS